MQHVPVSPAVALHDAGVVEESVGVVGEERFVSEADEHARADREGIQIVVGDVVVATEVALC